MSEPSPFPDARASDPRALGWMQGHPPPRDRLVRFADGSHYRFPQTRYSYSHMREFGATRAVPRGGPVSALPSADLSPAQRAALDEVRFQPLGQPRTMSWAEAFDAHYTDGLLVLHRGHIVYEKYAGELRPDGQHLAFSVTKSFIGLLGAMLVHEGRLDEQALVRELVPELADSAFGTATLRQLLDMTTGLDYSENYADPGAQVHAHARAGGFFPRAPDEPGPDSFYEFLKTVRPLGRHGEAFAYKTVNTDALGWVIRRATGCGLAQLLSERLWQPLGAEQDAYFSIDSHGTEFAGGGLNTGLRDLARVGEMMRCGGEFNGQRIVPAAVVADIQRGADRAHFASAGYATLPGASYRNMWWVLHNAHGAYAARGVHGQLIYVDPLAEMVIARYASHPMAANVHLDPTSLPAWQAMGEHLRRGL